MQLFVYSSTANTQAPPSRDVTAIYLVLLTLQQLQSTIVLIASIGPITSFLIDINLKYGYTGGLT
jgi:hypothetical protein